jgi:hypothetical protein
MLAVVNVVDLHTSYWHAWTSQGNPYPEEWRRGGGLHQRAVRRRAQCSNEPLWWLPSTTPHGDAMRVVGVPRPSSLSSRWILNGSNHEDWPWRRLSPLLRSERSRWWGRGSWHGFIDEDGDPHGRPNTEIGAVWGRICCGQQRRSQRFQQGKRSSILLWATGEKINLTGGSYPEAAARAPDQVAVRLALTAHPSATGIREQNPWGGWRGGKWAGSSGIRPK